MKYSPTAGLHATLEKERQSLKEKVVPLWGQPNFSFRFGGDVPVELYEEFLDGSQNYGFRERRR